MGTPKSLIQGLYVLNFRTYLNFYVSQVGKDWGGMQRSINPPGKKFWHEDIFISCKNIILVMVLLKQNLESRVFVCMVFCPLLSTQNLYAWLGNAPCITFIEQTFHNDAMSYCDFRSTGHKTFQGESLLLRWKMSIFWDTMKRILLAHGRWCQ